MKTFYQNEGGVVPLLSKKPLEGVVVTGPNWKTVPDGIDVLKPLSWSIESGTKYHGPRSVLLCEIVLPEEHAGAAVCWYCNAGYDKTLKRPVFARNSKLVRTFERLFPDEPGTVQESGGLLLEHYLIGLVTTTKHTRKGGKLIEKPEARWYSKVQELLEAGPRVLKGPPTRSVQNWLQEFSDQYEQT